jgi:hypothetical protein
MILNLPVLICSQRREAGSCPVEKYWPGEIRGIKENRNKTEIKGSNCLRNLMVISVVSFGLKISLNILRYAIFQTAEWSGIAGMNQFVHPGFSKILVFITDVVRSINEFNLRI